MSNTQPKQGTETMATVEDFYGEVIHEYTENDAIADGVLVEFDHENYPYLLLTAGVFAACEATSAKDGRTLAQVIVPLFQDAVLAVRTEIQKDPTNDLIILTDTAADTVYVRPNASGGMTILHPIDN